MVTIAQTVNISAYGAQRLYRMIWTLQCPSVSQTEKVAWQARRGRGRRGRYRGEMHHLSVYTGGRGGRQVMPTYYGVLGDQFI